MLSSFLRKISITKSKSICDRELLNSSPTDNDQSLLTKAIVLAPLKKLFPISTKLLTIALVAFALNAYSEGSDDKGSDKREVKFKAIAAGDLRSLALSKDGKVYVAGSNRFGQLGLGDSDHETNRHTFTEVTSLSAKTIVAISVGGFHSLALSKSGRVYAAGNNEAGQLGLGDNDNRVAFTEVSVFSD